MNPIGLLLVAAGAFSMAGAYFDWEWFMMSRRARLMVMIFGRNGARIFYGLLGGAIAVAGIMFTAGVLK